MTAALRVLATGPLSTVQDGGRPGRGSLGIGRSGACDRAAMRLANRLVGNPEETPVLEVTLGGLAVRAEDSDLVVALTGARCPGSAHLAVEGLAAGTELRLDPPVVGLRTYLAVRGGIAVEPVLGSCSTDLLSGLGPPVLEPGDRLAVGGAPVLPLPGVELAPVAEPEGGTVSVRVLPGPRRDWFGADGWSLLTGQEYRVSSDSNRVGVRLEGEALRREREGELPSEGMARGALQVPPSGVPVLFLADHPVTGGYPVIGYVAEPDVDRCAQLRPGQGLRLSSR